MRGPIKGAQKRGVYQEGHKIGVQKRGNHHKRGFQEGAQKGGLYQQGHKRGTFHNGGLPRGAQIRRHTERGTRGITKRGTKGSLTERGTKLGALTTKRFTKQGTKEGLAIGA